MCYSCISRLLGLFNLSSTGFNAQKWRYTWAKITVVMFVLEIGLSHELNGSHLLIDYILKLAIKAKTGGGGMIHLQ